MATRTTTGVLELQWFDLDGIVTYHLFSRDLDGQVRHCDSFEQGPFDTALEVAQWAWRTMSREVPPASC